MRLLGYQSGPQGWLRLMPDAHGRLDLAPVGVLIGLEGDRARLYAASTRERLLDYAEAVQAKIDAETRARDEAERCAALEERLRQLEEQLRRGPKQD